MSQERKSCLPNANITTQEVPEWTPSPAPTKASEWSNLTRPALRDELTQSVQQRCKHLREQADRIEQERTRLDSLVTELEGTDTTADLTEVTQKANALRNDVCRCLQNELSYRRDLDSYWITEKESIQKRTVTLQGHLDRKTNEVKEHIEKCGFVFDDRRPNECLHSSMLLKHPEIRELTSKLKDASRVTHEPAGGDQGKKNRQVIVRLEADIKRIIKKMSKL